MTDKDPNEDEFNQEDQDNINEADDSFGLPDLDFEPLDESSEDEPVDEEPPAAEEEQTVEEESPEETPEEAPEEEASEETAEEEVVASTESSFSSSSSTKDEPKEDAPKETKSVYVPPKPSSNGPKIIIGIVATIIVAVIVWFFAIYRPNKKAEEEAIRTEQLAKKAEQDRLAQAQKAKADSLAKVEAARKAAEEAKAKEATFITITEPTRRYYIVIESFVDQDLAADLGNKMAADGVSTAMLSPKAGKKKLYRLTLQQSFEGWRVAQAEADKLKAEYGDDLWVLRY